MALKDVRAPPTREEDCVCGIEEERRNYAASRDAQINLRSAQEAQGKDSRKLCSIEGCTNQSVQGRIVYEAWSKGKIMHYWRIHKSRQERRHLLEAWSKESTYNGRSVHETWSKGEPLCCIVGCTNQSRKGGVCIRHGAKKKRCSFEESSITNQAQTGAVCLRYGAKGKLCH